MQVKLYASLRQAAGTKMMDVQVQQGTTIHDVLQEVTRRYPVLEKYIWKQAGELSQMAHVFIDGQNIRHLAGLDTPVKECDHVDIFPPLVGGY
jgi:molybdopterin synthase sulfur carrier subunit